MARTVNTAARKPAARKVADKPAAVVIDNATGAVVESAAPATALAVVETAAVVAAPATALAVVETAAAATLPASHNSVAWLAMFESLPAWGEMLAEMRAHKYGKGKGLVPAAATMFSLTAIGAGMAATGTNKNGKPNVQAATCRALAIACRATGENMACGAAIVYYMLTDESVLALLRESKATKYVGKTGTPAPAWCSGYVTGNAREAFFTKR